jgi:putative SOS response-associated peptidase YedK
MCGRITLSSAPHALAETFFLDQVPDVEQRFNISPGQEIGAVVANPESTGHRYRMLNWGLVPPGTPDPRTGPKLINARSETVAQKRSFADSFASRRCLIPVTGFYEWKKEGTIRQPYLFRRKDSGLFALAGLWASWEYPGGQAMDTCTVLTTGANALMRRVHHRMPAILPAKDWKFWLDLPAQKADLLLAMLQPAPADELLAHPVTPRMNRPDFDGPECLEPVRNDHGGQLPLF